jgi:hypothetical protein
LWPPLLDSLLPEHIARLWDGNCDGRVSRAGSSMKFIDRRPF